MSEKVLSIAEIQVVTLKVAGQLFAIDLSVVDDVFKPEQFTKIPAARSEIAGILNLRGRIIVAIHTDRLLGLSSGKTDVVGRQMVNIKYLNESYGLLADSVGDVMSLNGADINPNPINLDGNLAKYSQGILRFDDELMVVLKAEQMIAQVLEQDAA